MPVRARAQGLRRSLMILGLIALAFIVLGTTLAYSQYRRDLSDARERLARGSHLVQTSCGAIEYSQEGNGKTVLSIHGAGGGWDQGLLISPFLGEGFRVIAPSRLAISTHPTPTIRQQWRKRMLLPASWTPSESSGYRSSPSLPAGLQRCNSPSDIPNAPLLW